MGRIETPKTPNGKRPIYKFWTSKPQTSKSQTSKPQYLISSCYDLLGLVVSKITSKWQIDIPASNESSSRVPKKIWYILKCIKWNQSDLIFIGRIRHTHWLSKHRHLSIRFWVGCDSRMKVQCKFPFIIFLQNCISIQHWTCSLVSVSSINDVWSKMVNKYWWVPFDGIFLSESSMYIYK